MKKITIYVDDNKAAFIRELLEHLDFVRKVETEMTEERELSPDANPADGGKGSDMPERDLEGGESKNIKQLRDALAAIDNVRDRNKKHLAD